MSLIYNFIIVRIIRIFEIIRMLSAGLGFYLAYNNYFHQNYGTALFYLILLVVLPLTGLTGIESIFFADITAKQKGWSTGSPYQIQSGINNIATALTAMIVLYFKWNIYAELTILFVTLFFLSLSSLNHMVAFFKQKDKKFIHILRLIFSILMVSASIPIIISVL